MPGKQAAEAEDQGAALVELAELDGDQAARASSLAELAAAAAAAAQSGQPVILERGRYRLYNAPDGAWVVARAVGLCDRCEACGCGDQAGLIQIPAVVIKLALAPGGGLFDKLKTLRAAGKAQT